MILEEMYSMREPHRKYTTEEKLDADVLCVDIEHWKKANELMHKKHAFTTIDLWENIK